MKVFFTQVTEQVTWQIQVTGKGGGIMYKSLHRCNVLYHTFNKRMIFLGKDYMPSFSNNQRGCI